MHRGGAKRPTKGRRAKTPAARKRRRARALIDKPQRDVVKRLKRERDEALELQAASAEVLKTISASPNDLESVFEAMLASALRICEAKFGHILLYDGKGFHAAYLHDVPPAYRTFWEQHGPISPSPNTGLGRLALTKQVAHIPDLKTDPAYAAREPLRVITVEQAGARSFLSVPMLKESDLIGAIVIYRQEVRPFAEKQIELVKHFADQAVIAIENARLFDEVQAKTRDLEESLQFQTAASDVLKVISRSPDALQPVLDVIVETSRELCGADASTIFLLREGQFHVAAVSGSSPAHLEHLRANPLSIGQRGSVLSRVAIEKRTLHYANVMNDPELRDGSTGLGGPRALLTVPLMKDGNVIGAITLRQSHRRPFSERQIQVIEVFADQAVIAISNVNLFEEVQQRTNELSKSLDDLRTAQDRLIQTEKLASLGQLTAGIAHEIKNPLNFVNNFAALSVELTDELKGALKPAALDQTIRAEVDEITGLLKDNLGKVVQHGKRADTIVKNMLVHSRSGSGERRVVEINAIIDESLNLAYHGARAEKQGFNITLERDFDPRAGIADVYPQEITRVLLNLISNGFYAATKRAAEVGNRFEPTLKVITRNLGDLVEIRIRDNGMGVPANIREEIFNPFFTTKPPGEGTGLGLSMSYDIVVKQHGGTVDVESEPGVFAEFIVTLPRKITAQAVAGEQKH